MPTTICLKNTVLMVIAKNIEELDIAIKESKDLLLLPQYKTREYYNKLLTLQSRYDCLSAIKDDITKMDDNLTPRSLIDHIPHHDWREIALEINQCLGNDYGKQIFNAAEKLLTQRECPKLDKTALTKCSMRF